MFNVSFSQIQLWGRCSTGWLPIYLLFKWCHASSSRSFRWL